MRSACAGQSVDQPLGALGLEVAADLVELLARISHQFAGATDIGEIGGQLQQRELAACYFVLGGHGRLPFGFDSTCGNAIKPARKRLGHRNLALGLLRSAPGSRGLLTGDYDLRTRLEALSARGDPLEAIDHLVPWRAFAPRSRRYTHTGRVQEKQRRPEAVRCHPMFRMLVLQALNNLSDEQVEYQVRDRLSFSRFLGLAIEDSIPDATTLWLFREKLAKAGLIEKLFDRFDQHLAAKGYMARGGQIIDASIVPVPTQRNSRDETAELQAGRTPAGWKQKPARLRQKDRNARWIKKHGRSFLGYKNHVNAGIPAQAFIQGLPKPQQQKEDKRTEKKSTKQAA